MQFDEFGREVPDTTPVPHRSQITRQHNLMASINAFVIQELARQAEAQGMESEEEANDFETDDDDEEWTVYEEEDYRASFPAEQNGDAQAVATGDPIPSPEPPPPDGGAPAP